MALTITPGKRSSAQCVAEYSMVEVSGVKLNLANIIENLIQNVEIGRIKFNNKFNISNEKTWVSASPKTTNALLSNCIQCVCHFANKCFFCIKFMSKVLSFGGSSESVFVDQVETN